MHWFTQVVCWLFLVAAIGSIAFVLFYNRPEPRRRQFHDRDPHESGFI